MKTCNKCGHLKPVESFEPKGNGKRRAICRNCRRSSKGLQQKSVVFTCVNCKNQLHCSNKSGVCKKCHIAQGGCKDCSNLAVIGKARCLDCLGKRAKNQKARRNRQRHEVIQRLGGKCVFCNNDVLIFLTIDHKNGNGNQHRKELTSPHISSWLLENWDKSVDYQVLCWNCNSARYIYGDEHVMYQLSIGRDKNNGSPYPL